MLKAGFSAFIGNVPFRMMADEYASSGCELTFGDNERLAKLASGEYDIIGVTVNSVLMSLDKVADAARIVYGYVRAAGEGSDLIVCRGDVRDAHELAALRIGVQKGSLAHFLFEYLFFTNGIAGKRDYRWMLRNEYFAAMSENRVDAAIFCDPALSRILHDGRFRLYGGDMRDVVLTALGVLVVRPAFLQERPHQVVQFVGTFLRGMEAVRQADSNTLRARTGDFFAGVEDPKNAVCSQVAFLDLAENRRLFSQQGTESLFVRCSDWQEVLDRSGLLRSAGAGLNVADLIDDGVITRLTC